MLLKEEDYDRALTRMNDIFQADIGTPEGDERDALFDLIEEYENEHYPIEPPCVIGAIEFGKDIEKQVKPRKIAHSAGN